MGSIIVTITNKEKGFYQDIEVPVQVNIQKLKDDIIDCLNAYTSSFDFPKHGVKIFHDRNQCFIEDTNTLEEAGVWNGDYISLIYERK